MSAAFGFVKVRRRHDNSNAGLEEVRKYFPKIPPGDRVNTGRGFVEKNDFWSVNESAGERQLLFHPAGKLIGKPRTERRQPRELEQLIPPRLVIPHAVNLGEKFNILVDSQVAVEAEFLR